MPTTHNSWCSTHMKSRHFQLRISCNLERSLRIRSRELQLRILEVCEPILEIFSAERIVLAYWKKRKEEREREKKYLNCWKAKKDVSSSLNAEQIRLNLRLWILCLLLKTHTLSLSLTHTQEKNSEWLQLQTVLISQNQQNLWKTSKPNFFSKLENQANLFENLKTKKSLKKQQNLWKLQNQEIFETLDFKSNDVHV
jgi:hypothetical protein